MVPVHRLKVMLFAIQSITHRFNDPARDRVTAFACAFGRRRLSGLHPPRVVPWCRLGSKYGPCYPSWLVVQTNPSDSEPCHGCWPSSRTNHRRCQHCWHRRWKRAGEGSLAARKMEPGAVRVVRMRTMIRECAGPLGQGDQEMRAMEQAACWMLAAEKCRAAIRAHECRRPCVACPNCSMMEASRHWQGGAVGPMAEVRRRCAAATIAELCSNR
jgi:hypothetical protein